MDKDSKKGVELWNEGLYEPLKTTLEYAKENIPYYASKIKTIAGQTIESLLNCVPILDKETAIDNLQRLRKNKINQPGRISTGTLRKNHRFMDVQYINDEDEAIQAFYRNGRSWFHAYHFRDLDLSSQNIPQHQESGIILRILNAHYEIPQCKTVPSIVSILWTSHANSFEIIKETLINFSSINILDIESSTLIKLTIMLEQIKFDFHQIQVGGIFLHGFISNKWRDFILKKWNCPISETFSLSEIRAKAYQCENHEEHHFHFDTLPIITEIINPHTKEAITSGAGLLALTPLYPFAQQQLLLRYLTQDVVKIVTCDKTSKLGFSWCGRERDVIFLEKTDIAHSSFGLREVLECLDKYYEIARSTDDFEILGIIETGSVGWPLFKIEHLENSDSTQLNLHIILTYPPYLFPDKTDELCKKIKSEIIGANDYLYKKYDNKRLKVEIIPYPPSKKNELNNWHYNQFQQIVRNRAIDNL